MPGVQVPDTIDRIADIASRAVQAGPAIAVPALQQILAITKTQKNGLAQIGATHILRLPSIPAVPPGTILQPSIKPTWPGGGGRVMGFFAGTKDGSLAGLSAMSVRIRVNGQEDLVVTGQGEAYAPLVSFNPQNHNWFRTKAYIIDPTAIWEFTFQNESSGLPAPVLAAVATSNAGGTLAAATYFYKVTALDGNGETVASNEQSVVTAGATSSNLVAWQPVAGAVAYRVYRGTAAGAENVFYTVGAGANGATSFLDTGAMATAGAPPAANTTGVTYTPFLEIALQLNKPQTVNS